MSVHTPVPLAELESLLSRYDLGELIDYTGIKDGVTNTNYVLTTDTGRYILTLFEQLDPAEIELFLNITTSLQQQGFPCPVTMLNKQGRALQSVCHKPAVISECLAGDTLRHQPSLNQCQALGQTIARLHQLGQNISQPWPIDTRDNTWRHETCQSVLTRINKDDKQLLLDEVSFQDRTWPLPQGLIHADVFRDNVLFSDQKLSGIIDFFYSCKGYYLYDLAIIVNDWCLNDDFSINEARFLHFINAYQQQRPLTATEPNTLATNVTLGCFALLAIATLR